MQSSRRGEWRLLAVGLVMLGLLATDQEAQALIFGGVGNDKVNDPGWPQGADKVFNVPQRVAWWEGPPFGGGQWHGECRGNAADFNRVLADFAAIDAKTKRLVIYDGAGASFWLGPNRGGDQAGDARIDWTFVVWVPENFERLRGLPPDLRAFDAKEEPTPQIDVYTGFNIRWSDVQVPAGLDVVDNRLEAHGFAVTDGTVLDGTVTELATGRPLAAQIELQLIESQEQGGYRYTTQQTAQADTSGRWVLKSAPSGWYQAVVSAEGFVPRIAGHYQFDGQPRYVAVSTGLARGGTVRGRMLDDSGKPLEGVEVRVSNLAPQAGGRYETASEPRAVSAADGTFLIENVPVGTGSLWMTKSGYVRPGLGPQIEIPATGLEYRLDKAANVLIVVDFEGFETTGEYLVHMEPEGGSQVGSWGGSGRVDTDGRLLWSGIPAGRYVIYGSPNPGSDATKSAPVTVELKGGETTKAVIKAKRNS
jgi:hypothetical protein